MTKGKLRRNIDLRLVSYALSVLKDNSDNPELAVAARFLAAASLQLAGGYRALIDTCRASAESEAIRKSMQPDQARRCSVMFEALAESLEDHRKGGFQELVELIVVFAGEAMDDDNARHGLDIWANGLGINTAPLVVHDEDDDEGEEVVEIGDPIKKRKHKPRKRTTRGSYNRDRFDDLLREAIATGIDKARPRMAGGRIEILGVHPRRGEVHLRWLRSSMAEGEKLTDRLNEELRRMRSSDPSSRGSISA